MGDEGVDLLMLVGVAEQAGALVEQQEVFIFIDDVQLGLKDGQKGVVLPWGLKELVVDVELQGVPLGEPDIPAGALAVDLDPLEADVFLGQGCGEEGESFGQPAVQALPGVISADGKGFHRGNLLAVVLRTVYHSAGKKEKEKNLWERGKSI